MGQIFQPKVQTVYTLCDPMLVEPLQQSVELKDVKGEVVLY